MSYLYLNGKSDSNEETEKVLMLCTNNLFLIGTCTLKNLLCHSNRECLKCGDVL